MGLGLVQMVILAQMFGTSPMVDAFFVAQSVPFFFLGLVENTLNATFLPVFVHVREKEGNPEAWAVARSVLAVSGLFFSVLCLLLIVGAPFIAQMLAPGFADNTLKLTERMMKIMAPTMVLIFLAAFASSICFSYRRFHLPAIANLIPVTGGILSLLLLGRRMGIVALPIGLVCAFVIQALFLLRGIKSKYPGENPPFRLFHPGTLRVFKLMGPRFLNASLINIDLMVDRFFASILGGGLIAALAYAQRISRVPMVLLLGSLGRVMISELSRFGAKKQYDEMLHLINRVLKMVLFVVIPIMVFFVIFREPILQVILLRGRFDEGSVSATAIAILFYSFGFVLAPVGGLLRWAFFSIQDTLTPLKVGILASLSNIVLDLFLMSKMGHAGIALATSLVIIQNCVLLWVKFSDKIKRSPFKLIEGGFFRLLAADGILAFGLWIASHWLRASQDISVTLVGLGTLFVSGMALYLTVAYLLRVREVYDLFRILSGRFRHRGAKG